MEHAVIYYPYFKLYLVGNIQLKMENSKYGVQCKISEMDS